MNTVYDYEGRKVDLAIFRRKSESVWAELEGAFGGLNDSGTAVTGVLKLGQSVLLELFTQQGSLFYKQFQGSSLPRELGSGAISSPRDLLAGVSRALLAVETNIKARETEDTPADERYGRVTVESVAWNPGNAIIYLRITSADPAATIVLPTNILA